MNFALMQHHKYSLTELENLIPWEREIYINLLTNFIKDENEKLKMRLQTQKHS
jgi:DNA replication initiation complex subunit (GINS family)